MDSRLKQDEEAIFIRLANFLFSTLSNLQHFQQVQKKLQLYKNMF